MGKKDDGGQKEGRVDQRPGPASQLASWACFAARHGPASQRVTVEHAQHVSLRSSFSSGVYKCPLYLRRNTFFKFQCSKLQTDRQTLRLEVGDGGIQAIAGILALARPCLCKFTNVSSR